MNALQFFIAQLDAEQRFRKAMESFQKQFEPQELNDGEKIQTTDSTGQLDNSTESSDISSRQPY